jgi:hypothetical protein
VGSPRNTNGNWATKSDPIFLAIAQTKDGTPFFFRPSVDLRAQLAVSRDFGFFDDYKVKFPVPKRAGDSEKNLGVRLTLIE